MPVLSKQRFDCIFIFENGAARHGACVSRRVNRNKTKNKDISETFIWLYGVFDDMAIIYSSTPIFDDVLVLELDYWSTFLIERSLKERRHSVLGRRCFIHFARRAKRIMRILVINPNNFRSVLNCVSLLFDLPNITDNICQIKRQRFISWIELKSGSSKMIV